MMWTYLNLLFGTVRARIDELRRHPDAGYTTETVVVTAVLIAAALVVVGILVAKAVSKANEINLGM
ncbi:hypothetical protein [Saccharopolyspora phatthalungensis]|uniref:Integral membrane protein n=1 Tax=Saccharopolyspora phatthalungensis TaxID=664693 RepID=A0A840Q855_9PSEU|nr:hypothetical protein [Saccharopolyspora phatthalungensis]MBB5155921.1 hypothetical protein [Saccharopolyspora phatthalungensis]